MPELPEVETIRRQLAVALPGASVVAAAGHPSTKFSEASNVIGTCFQEVRRRGKYLLVATDDDRELVIHLGMTGHLGFRNVPENEPDPLGGDRWRRAWWQLGDGRVFEFHDVRRFGRITVVPTGHYDRLATLAAMGPEPLDPNFTPKQFHRLLAAQRRPIKTALLAQRVVAGVGNIYADEALWRAGINPATRRISLDRATRLHATLTSVLAAAIDHGGTRLRDYRTVAGDTGQHQWHLDCYGRSGQPCNRCGNTLDRRVIDGRGTTWCRCCQAR